MNIRLGIILLAILLGCSHNNKNGTPSVSSTKTMHPALSFEQRQGRYLYVRYCAICHGEQGKGDGFNAFNLQPKPRDFTDVRFMRGIRDERLSETITEGGRGVNKSPLMPSWGGRLSRQQIAYLVSYLRFFEMSNQVR